MFMPSEVYNQLNRDARNYNIYKCVMYAGSFGVSYIWLQPTSILGYLGTTATSFLGGAAALTIVDLAKKKI